MIQIDKLSKSYNTQTVIGLLSLTIKKGTVYALLGKNGAGKTTLINLITDLLPVDSGSITINNLPHNQLSSAEKRHMGVVGEQLGLIDEFNAYDYLKFVGKVYNIPHTTLKQRIDDLLNYFFDDLNELKKSIAKYSTGMRKKIAFCAAVIHTPDLLILDEPFSGLDPVVANQMINFLKHYQNSSRTILISSHDLNYVEKVATHIGVLHKAQLLFNSTLADFTLNGESSIDKALLEVLQPSQKQLQNINWL